MINKTKNFVLSHNNDNNSYKYCRQSSPPNSAVSLSLSLSLSKHSLNTAFGFTRIAIIFERKNQIFK